MRGLSFSQPWLWSILHAGKRVENRPWMPAIEMIGQRFALHAAKSWDDDAIGFFLRLGIDFAPSRRALYPTGSIVGLATIDRIVTDDKTLDAIQKRWFFGPVGIILSDVWVFHEHIPCRGMLGMWTVPAELEPEIVRVAAGATAAQMPVYP